MKTPRINTIPQLSRLGRFPGDLNSNQVFPLCGVDIALRGTLGRLVGVERRGIPVGKLAVLDLHSGSATP